MRTIVNESKAAGYTATIDGNKLANGIYFYRMEGNNFVDVKKIILVK